MWSNCDGKFWSFVGIVTKVQVVTIENFGCWDGNWKSDQYFSTVKIILMFFSFKLDLGCRGVDQSWFLKKSFILQFLLMEKPKKCSFNIDGIKSTVSAFQIIKSIVTCIYLLQKKIEIISIFFFFSFSYLIWFLFTFFSPYGDFVFNWTFIVYHCFKCFKHGFAFTNLFCIH